MGHVMCSNNQAQRNIHASLLRMANKDSRDPFAGHEHRRPPLYSPFLSPHPLTCPNTHSLPSSVLAPHNVQCTMLVTRCSSHNGRHTNGHITSTQLSGSPSWPSHTHTSSLVPPLLPPLHQDTTTYIFIHYQPLRSTPNPHPVNSTPPSLACARFAVTQLQSVHDDEGDSADEDDEAHVEAADNTFFVAQQIGEHVSWSAAPAPPVSTAPLAQPFVHFRSAAAAKAIPVPAGHRALVPGSS